MTAIRLTRRHLEDLTVEYCQRMYAAGWVASCDGHLSVRIGEDRFLVTPGGIPRCSLNRDALVLLDGDGKRISGGGEPFHGVELHLSILRARPELRAVLRAHPPTVMGLSAAGVALQTDLLADAVLLLGKQIPSIPCMVATDALLAQVMPLIHEHDAILLERRGVLAFGTDLQSAFVRVELVEHLARVHLTALQAGGAHSMSAAILDQLLALRAAKSHAHQAAEESGADDRAQQMAYGELRPLVGQSPRKVAGL